MGPDPLLVSCSVKHTVNQFMLSGLRVNLANDWPLVDELCFQRKKAQPE